MGLLSRTKKLERPPKSSAKARGIVPHDLETTAPLRTIEREGRNDGVPSSLQRQPEARDICRTVFFLGQKVKRCPIMPDVVSLGRCPNCGVRDHPVNLCSVLPKASFSGLKCSLRQVENGNVLEASLNEVIDQT